MGAISSPLFQVGFKPSTLGGWEKWAIPTHWQTKIREGAETFADFSPLIQPNANQFF
jgi:hypothetical protein